MVWTWTLRANPSRRLHHSDRASIIPLPQQIGPGRGRMLPQPASAHVATSYARGRGSGWMELLALVQYRALCTYVGGQGNLGGVRGTFTLQHGEHGSKRSVSLAFLSFSFHLSPAFYSYMPNAPVLTHTDKLTDRCCFTSNSMHPSTHLSRPKDRDSERRWGRHTTYARVQTHYTQSQSFYRQTEARSCYVSWHDKHLAVRANQPCLPPTLAQGNSPKS